MTSSNISTLRLLVQSKTGASEPEIKIALSRIGLDISERLKQPPSLSTVQFLSGVTEALARIRGSAHAEQRMSFLCDIAIFFSTNSYHSKALQAAHGVETIAGRIQDANWLRKSDTLAGVVHAELGNVAEAIVRLSSALKTAHQIGDTFQVVSVLCNLGAALNYGGLYRDAVTCLERVVSLARTDRVRDQSAHVTGDPAFFELSGMTNLAQSHFFLEESEVGLGLIQTCLAKSRQPINTLASYNRTIREFTFVLLALDCLQFDQAAQHAAECRRYARMGGSKTLVLSEIAEGLCEVYRGDPNRGLSLLEASLATNEAHESWGLRIDALLALTRALDEMGQSERALECVRRALRDIKRSRESGAIAMIKQFGDENPKVTAEREDLRKLQFAENALRVRVAENDVENLRHETFERLAITADLREDASGAHGYRVGCLARLIAEELGWAREESHALEMAARLHDIGKIGMPDSILLKASNLLAGERRFVNAHTSIGAEILSKSGLVHMRLAEEIARYHHEWWDGTGYPAKRSARRIPISARIVAIADVFDALTHGRPYAAPWPTDRALGEIGARKGTQFDPLLTDAFLNMARQNLTGTSIDELTCSDSSTFSRARSTIRTLMAEGSEHAAEENELETER